jgi:parallel beta-helix repeat protein
MKEFVEYAETHEATIEPGAQQTMRQMLTNARTLAGNTVYGQRIDLLLGLINSNSAGEDVMINSCQSLDSLGSVYKLTSDVSSVGTCFTLNNYAVTIDCQGHTITYGTGGGRDYYGFYGEWKDGITIKNCKIVSGGSSTGEGVRFSNSRDISIENSKITTQGNGVWFIDSSNTNVINSNITSASGTAFFTQTVGGGTLSNNVLSSSSSYGMYLYQSSGFTVTSNNASGSVGAQITESSSNTFLNNRFISASNIGITLASSNNNQFTGQTVIGGVYAILIDSNSNSNIFQNCGQITGGIINGGSSNVFTNCS